MLFAPAWHKEKCQVRCQMRRIYFSSLNHSAVLMNDTNDALMAPADLFMPSGAGDSSAPPQEAPSVRRLDLRFTGSGSEYFRIWIVNLLLTLVTLTLYWPFARARRLVYFHRNTLLGTDALGFHADPWKMFRGYLLMLALGGVYWGVSRFVPALKWLPLLVMAALWPLLWRSSLFFRLSNTSWRGVRFGFAGSVGMAYRVMLPLLLPMMLLVLAGSFVEAPDLAQKSWIQTFFVLTGGLTVVFLLGLPWLMARLSAYQHSGYVFTRERSSLETKQIIGGLYLIGLKIFGIALLLVLLAGLLAAAAGAGAGKSGVLVILGLFYVVIPLVLLPYFQARVQNLLWGQTRSEQIEIHSELHFTDLFKVNALNWLLIVVTLGLYWPFAAVRTARVRLQALAVEVHGDVDTWVAEAPQRPGGVLGDAAGDALGLDMGL